MAETADPNVGGRPLRALRVAVLLLSCAGCAYSQMDDTLYALALEAMDPATPADRLRAIVQTKDRRLEEKMYGSDEQLGKNRKGLAVLRLIVQNPNVNADILLLIAESRNDYVIGDVLGHPLTPKAVLDQYKPGQKYLWDWGLARNPSTDPQALTALAGSDNEYTRASVARNPSTPPETLRRLVRDPNWIVRRDLTLNPKADQDLRTTLAADEDVRVRNAVPPR